MCAKREKLATHSFMSQVPELVTLHAPFTPFHVDAAQSLNIDVVPALAANARALGVNTIWVGGGMGAHLPSPAPLISLTL